MSAATAPVLQVPRRPLGATGLQVSVLGFGASTLGSVYQPVDAATGAAAVAAAFRRGVNFFDTSPYYGATRSESALGAALAALGAPRASYVVATKVGRYGPDDFDFSAARAAASVRESLARLRLDYIDLIQCHDVEFGDLDLVVRETLPALAALKAQGLVRHIGVTGLPLAALRRVLDAAPPGAVDVVLSYCHHTLFDASLPAMLPYLESKGVGVVNASPLSMGLLTPQGAPEWHPAPPALKAAAAAAAAAAATAGASLPRVALVEALRAPAGIATTLVGMCTPAEVEENVEAALIALGVVDNPHAARDAAALTAARAALAPFAGVTWPSGRPENN